MAKAAAPLLRAVDPADLEDLLALRAQPILYSNTLGLPHPTRAEWKRKLENPPEGLIHIGAVVDGKLVGSASLLPHKGRRRHVGEIGMGVHDDYQGRGIGKALLDAILDQADNWLQLKRLELIAYADNARALTLYERAGFEREGLLRAYAFRAGSHVDAFLMARLRL